MKKNTTFLIALFLICASFSLSAQTITISDTPPGVDGCYSQVGAMPPITMLSLSGTTTVGGVRDVVNNNIPAIIANIAHFRHNI